MKENIPRKPNDLRHRLLIPTEMAVERCSNLPSFDGETKKPVLLMFSFLANHPRPFAAADSGLTAYITGDGRHETGLRDTVASHVGFSK
jgi:hypothetical protein